MTERKPNPGSKAAVAAGCICPVLDNSHGKWPPWPPDGWWIRPDCEIHGPGSADEPATETSD